jgi:hypothetical protein
LADLNVNKTYCCPRLVKLLWEKNVLWSPIQGSQLDEEMI